MSSIAICLKRNDGVLCAHLFQCALIGYTRMLIIRTKDAGHQPLTSLTYMDESAHADNCTIVTMLISSVICKLVAIIETFSPLLGV